MALSWSMVGETHEELIEELDVWVLVEVVGANSVSTPAVLVQEHSVPVHACTRALETFQEATKGICPTQHRT